MSGKRVYIKHQLEMYLTRRDRRRRGLRYTSTGPEFHFDDQAIMLWGAIQESDCESGWFQRLFHRAVSTSPR